MNLQHRHRYPSYKYSRVFTEMRYDHDNDLYKVFNIWDGSPQKEVIIANMEVSYNSTNTREDAVILVIEHGNRSVTNPPSPFVFEDPPTNISGRGTGNIQQRVWQGLVSPISDLSDDSVDTIITKINAFKLPKSDRIYLIAQRSTTEGGQHRFSSMIISFDILEI